MKIIRIFENRLLAFHYDEEEENEYERLMGLWTDPLYVRNFLRERLSFDKIDELAMDILADGKKLDSDLEALSRNTKLKMEFAFRPLHNQEYQVRALSKQKARKNYLRLYALQIDSDCFVITGGAIKLTHLMEDSPLTLTELAKLEKARSFLQDNGIRDVDSFFEFIIEQDEE